MTRPLFVLAVCLPVLLAQQPARRPAVRHAQQTIRRPVAPAGRPQQTVVAPTPIPSGGARRIHYSDLDIPLVRTQLRYTTLILLPAGEDIREVLCGDKSFWQIGGTGAFVHIKPSMAGVNTNLTLITTARHVYTFLLSESATTAPDLKIFVDVTEEPVQANAEGARLKEELAAAQRQLAQARSEAAAATEEAKRVALKQLNAFRNTFPAQIRFGYRFNRKPDPAFLVTEIFTDGSRTYIKCAAPELPALYELRNGEPNLIHSQYRNGIYVVDKVLGPAYLQIGKKRFTFSPDPTQILPQAATELKRQPAATLPTPPPSLPKRSQQ